MLPVDQIDALGESARKIAGPISEYLIRDIVRRIAEAGQLTSTAQYQVWRLQQLGVSKRALKRELRQRLRLSHREIRKIMYQSAQSGYHLDISRFPYIQALPFQQNVSLQRIVSTAVALAQTDFTNLTQTLGMVDPYGNTLPLQAAYRSCTDFAFQQVVTGAASYTEAIRQATKNLAAKGVRTIDYESGAHTSLEAAVRRNILGGLGLMQEQVSQITHDQLGCDGWEISAHANSAPDHEPIQGKQYPDTAYQALNNSLVRRIGTLNCGHAAFPIILGVNRPQYTPEELEKFRTDNEKGVTVTGVHYTGYQATQMQRKLERAIRAQKRRVMVDEAAGDEEKLAQDKTKLTVLRQRYREFSKAAGLRTQEERIEVAGFGEKLTNSLVSSPNSGIIGSNDLREIPEMIETPTPAPKPEAPDKAAAVDVTEEYLSTATPGHGSITYDDGYDMRRHQAEVSFSKWLHDKFGGDIRLLNEVNAQMVKTADYLWREKLWDLKTVTTEKAANAALRHGLQQIRENPGGVFLDYRGVSVDLDILASVIKKRLQWRKDTSSIDIIIVLDDGIRVWRY